MQLARRVAYPVHLIAFNAFNSKISLSSVFFLYLKNVE